ncbi:MAG TPA: hypothetical protein VFT61_04075 [Sphingomicrobium sp.]|nr:hypothetical protein [Sphingomicrobium sp.]
MTSINTPPAVVGRLSPSLAQAAASLRDCRLALGGSRLERVKGIEPSS